MAYRSSARGTIAAGSYSLPAMEPETAKMRRHSEIQRRESALLNSRVSPRSS